MASACPNWSVELDELILEVAPTDILLMVCGTLAGLCCDRYEVLHNLLVKTGSCILKIIVDSFVENCPFLGQLVVLMKSIHVVFTFFLN